MTGPDIRYSNEPSYPKRPIRAALVATLGLGSLVVAAAIFVGGLDPIAFLVTGLVCSAFLAFLVVGLGLCSFQLAKWGLLVTLVLVVLGLLVVGPALLLRPMGEAGMVLASVIFGLLILSIIVDSAFAAFGWMRFARRAAHPEDGVAEPADYRARAQTAGVAIKRLSQITFCMTSFYVLLDGREIGSVKPGKAETFQVTPGEHSMQLHAGCWYRSERLVFSAQPGQTIRLECGSRIKGWRVLLSPLLLFSPGAWVYIRRK
jgi:hypothetical protein